MYSYHTKNKPKKSHLPNITKILSTNTTFLLIIISNFTKDMKNLAISPQIHLQKTF